MKETGIFVNGKFIECDINNLEILIKGNVRELNIAPENKTVMANKHTYMDIGSIGQMNIGQQFNGYISGGTFCMGTIINHSENNEETIEEIPSIRINVNGNINNLLDKTSF